MKIVGLHINKLEARHLPYLPAMRSAWTTMLDPEQGQVSEVKRASGGKVLARVYVADHELHRRIDEDPEGAGRWAAQLCVDQRWKNPDADAWIVVNEKDVNPLVSMAKLARYDIAFIDALKPHGMRAGMAAFAMGTPQIPDIDGGAALLEYAPALEHGFLHRALLCIHQYIPAGPGITQPSDALYFQARWQKSILPWLRARGIRYPHYLVTEVGCDLGGGLAASRGYTGYFAGWQVERPWGFGNDSVGIALYVQALRDVADVYAADPDCVGMTIFCVGGNGDQRWESFRVDEILGQLGAEAFPAPSQNVPPTTPGIEVMRLDIPYVSQEFPDAQTDYALGECLQAGVLALARATGRRETLNHIAQLTGLPRGYTASHIVTHGVHLAPKLGLRLIFGSWLTAQDIRNELRARRTVLARGWYPFLPKRYYRNYNNYHFFTIHGFEGSTFFYDDPGWESRTEGENITISEADLMRVLNRRSGGGAPAQALLLRSHTLPVWRMA